ncbi:lipoprotein signal peptidase [Solitalea canadensis]|uniref:Lipoprotein signal peptidase n=1 Tax=Solitalea canadensis (strain ATCC 29591 / DSM 3403 / JCM 21819 / LMG 8368 / NBRC 15130 / NCIMB 12057 / USAM 9D) TaxID=929556 RepID=H8KWZ3_SOLCM|nr:lipoprotein signal peptidase [Solitalea canadensis]AFD08322.1 lipoprotein signal peptidase [Solitalea canadensis DSM 3403]
MKRSLKAILIITLVVLADQLLKTWIKNNMYIGQEFNIIGNWFIIHFTENNGMAFGMEFAGEYGKLFLTLFRIAAVAGIGYGIHYVIKHRYPFGLVIAASLIFAGALGNIIDSVFYGVIYGYSTLLHGRVVDMFYFPVVQGHFPSWFPLWGDQEFVFFRPVFNIADAAISTGVAMILVFQKKYFRVMEKPPIEEDDTQSEVVEA